jgi:DNA-binding NarL/FixJ family response regulator
VNAKDPQRSPRRPPPSRIVIADDHPLYLEALRRVLEGCSALQVVGEATNGKEALELCRRLGPDVVLMDVRMPEMDGLAATRAIKREMPNTVVLLITAFDNPSFLSEAIKTGASGYVLKDATSREIINAIGKALEGEVPLNRGIATRLLRNLLDEQVPIRPEEHPRSPFFEKLSPREIEVLRLIVRGLTNKNIARDLHISVSTVKKHVQSITTKLGVSDRVQAAVTASSLGFFQDREG